MRPVCRPSGAPVGLAVSHEHHAVGHGRGRYGPGTHQSQADLVPHVPLGPRNERRETSFCGRKTATDPIAVGTRPAPIPCSGVAPRASPIDSAGVVLLAGSPPPEAWAGATVVRVDDAALAARATWSAAARGVEHAHAGGHRAGGRPGRFRAPEADRRPAVAARRRLRAVGRPSPLPRVGEQLRRPCRRRADVVVGPQGGPPAGARSERRARRARRRAPRRRRAGLDRRRPAGPARRPLDGAAVVHSDAGRARGDPRRPSRLRSRPPRCSPPTSSPEAVAHGAGPARIIAPAGSGKTRGSSRSATATSSADRGYEREAVVALAYNKKAQEEMAARLPGAGRRGSHPDAQRLGLRHPQPGPRSPPGAARRARGAVDRREAGAEQAAAA